jgi:hypothetical protein
MDPPGPPLPMGPPGAGPPPMAPPMDDGFNDPNRASVAPSMAPYPGGPSIEQPVYGWRRFIGPGMAGLGAITTFIGLVVEMVVLAQSVVKSVAIAISLRCNIRQRRTSLSKQRSNKQSKRYKDENQDCYSRQRSARQTGVTILPRQAPKRHRQAASRYNRPILRSQHRYTYSRWRGRLQCCSARSGSSGFCGSALGTMEAVS